MSQWVHDVELPQGALGKHRLVLTEQFVAWGDSQVWLDAIVDVGVRAVRQSVNGIPAASSWAVRLGDGTRTTTLKWGVGSVQARETKDRCHEAFDTLMGLLQARVAPRIAAGVAATTNEFHPWTFVPVGIHHKGWFGEKTIPWADLRGASVEDGLVAPHYLDANGRSQRLAGTSVWEPNAWFLAWIMEAQRRKFQGA